MKFTILLCIIYYSCILTLKNDIFKFYVKKFQVIQNIPVSHISTKSHPAEIFSVSFPCEHYEF